MGLVRSYPISARSLSDESLSSLQYWPWVGVGVLLAFIFLSFVLGGLERLRGNSVGEVEEKARRIADQSNEIKAHEDEIRAQKNETKAREDEIQAQKNEVKAREDEIKALRDRIKALKHEVRAQEDKIETQKDEIEAQKGEVKAQGGRIKARGGEIKAQGDRIKALEDEVGAQKDKIKAQKDEIKAQRDRIKAREDEIKAQKGEMKAQKDEIRTHQNSIQTLEIGRDKLMERVSTLNIRKTRLEDQNKALDQTLQGKNAELGRNNTTITQLRNEVTSKDEEIAEKNQTIAANEVTIGDLRLAKNRVNQDLITARGRIRDLEGREEQLERRINFSQEVTADNEDAYAETIDNLEDRIRDLRLEKNRLTGDLTGAQRTTSHNERTIARLERMIDFLQQRTADLDGDEDSHAERSTKHEAREERGNRMLSIMPGSWQDNLPQEEDASDMEEVPGATGSSIRDVQIHQLIIGLQQMLHLQGPCRHVELDGAHVAEIDSIIRHTTDLMDRLNDAMHQELVLLVLDIMGHLGVGQ